MGNQEHLEILWQGVEVWNEWREKNPDVKPDFNGENLSVANLKGANLAGALLNRATLTGANLAEANFNRAYLNEANLSGAKLSAANLSGAKLTGAILTEADFSSANLTEAYLNGAYATGANFIKASLDRAVLHEAHCNGACVIGATLVEANLSEADFSVADLSAAIFSKAILSRINFFAANLTGADLSEAQLTEAQVLATKFEKATFTGVCLQDWNINSSTNFDGVICDYAYWKRGQQERRPHSGNFAPGDFIKLVQDSLETVDLIFKEGVNWKAFTYSFHNTQVENEGTPLAIRSIENKGDGVVLIRVTVPPDVDKGKIHGDFIQGYEFAQKTLESHYRVRLEDKDKHINQLFNLLQQAQEKSGEVQKLMAEKSGIQQNFYGNPGSVAGNVEGDQKTIQHNYAPEQKQTLAEAAAEIQQFLAQLQTQGYSPETAQQQVASDLAKRVQNNPEAKSRLAKWGQYLGDAAANGLIGEAVVTVLKLAAQLAGIPIP